MSSDYQLEDTIYLPFTTRSFSTGVPTTLAGAPAIDIYEDATATPIVTGETLTVDLNTVAGFNMITVTATAATGFGAGQSYTAIIQAGTVGGVSVVGEVVAHFTLDKSAAAKDLANGTDGLGAIKAETALIVADTNELQTDDVPGLIAALNNIAATDIVSAGAITTLAGAVVNVDTVDTCTTNTDMRGTDSAATAANLAIVDTVVDGIQTDLSNATDGLGALKALIDTVNTDLSNPTDGLGALKALIDTVDTVADAIKTVTDKFVFTVANQVDANVQSINDVTITGDGSATPFNV